MELNNEYSKLLTAFEDKKKNVYSFSSSYWNWYDLQNAQEKYSVMQDKINAAIKHYNLEVEQKKELKDELIRINKLIAARDLKEKFAQYRQHLEERNNFQRELTESEEKLQQYDSDISEILSQKKHVSIALDFINEALSYIFFNNKRLVLENAYGEYRLKSNGKDVKPRDVSTGERNAIALCYFFAKIFENHEKDNRYKDELLVVLDDPITSFDKDNKVGIMTLLRWQISEIFNGCDASKILIMSHDLMTVFDIQKLFNEIDENKFRVLELKNKQVSDLGIFKKHRNEYKKIMDEVFAMANGQSDDFISIGNKMRRMEEAYSSFISNSKFEKLLHNDDFLEKVPDEKKTLFKNLMSRLILNTESHTEEKAYDMDVFSTMFDEDEIRKTAKYLLMLFWYVDNFHLKSYLGDDIKVVEQWLNED